LCILRSFLISLECESGHFPYNSEEKDNLFPAKISKKGKYGYEVEWADGAKIIYSLLAIAKAAGGKPLESTHE